VLTANLKRKGIITTMVNTIKSPHKIVWFITFCLLTSLIMGTFQTHRVQSISRLGSGVVEIQDLDLSEETAKILLVLDEETGSSEFRERSTSWVVINQSYGITAIPIGRADPDWKLFGTNNVTIWHWKLEKTLSLPYQTNGRPFFQFPDEIFTITFYVATNLSRRFIASVDIPNFSVLINQKNVDYNQSTWMFELQGCPYFMKVDVFVFHNQEYRIVILMLYIVLFIILATGGLLLWKRNHLDHSDFFRISSSLLIFAPVFFFTFRNSIAPPYLTTVDVICFITAIMHGSLLLGKLATRSRRKENIEKETQPQDKTEKESAEKERETRFISERSKWMFNTQLQSILSWFIASVTFFIGMIELLPEIRLRPSISLTVLLCVIYIVLLLAGVFSAHRVIYLVESRMKMEQRYLPRSMRMTIWGGHSRPIRWIFRISNDGTFNGVNWSLVAILLGFWVVIWTLTLFLKLLS